MTVICGVACHVAPQTHINAHAKLFHAEWKMKDSSRQLPCQPSRSAKKRESTKAQKLGEELTKIKPDERQKLGLPLELAEALAMHDRISSREGARRQRQYIGKIMRNLDTAEIAGKLSALKDVKSEQLAKFKKAELAREKLLSALPGDLEKLIAGITASEKQRVILLDLATKARETVSEAESGRAKKELFRILAAL